MTSQRPERWFPSIVRSLPQSWQLRSWTWWRGEELPRKIDIPSVWRGIENGPLGRLYPHVYYFLFPKSCISLFSMVMACGTDELWRWGFSPIYVINNILEKPGTLSLDDMLFGGGGSKDTQHLKTDWSFTKDPHVCVCKLHRGPRGSETLAAAAAACLPLVHFYFARLDSFIPLWIPVNKKNPPRNVNSVDLQQCWNVTNTSGRPICVFKDRYQCQGSMEACFRH